jgi:hypothetical protein
VRVYLRVLRYTLAPWSWRQGEGRLPPLPFQGRGGAEVSEVRQGLGGRVLPRERAGQARPARCRARCVAALGSFALFDWPIDLLDRSACQIGTLANIVKIVPLIIVIRVIRNIQVFYANVSNVRARARRLTKS